MATSGTLKQQFQTIQEQQQKKLQRRKQLQKDAQKPASGTSVGFGIGDEMGLQLSEPPMGAESYISEELVDLLHNEIRELKDENGRLYKLLEEKNFELKQIKKKIIQEKASDTAGVTNETAATKIVELSRKVRELNSELESERTKTKQITKKFQDLQNQVQTGDNVSISASTVSSAKSANQDEKCDDEVDVKSLQDKLRQTELRAAEARNQCLSLRQELKLAQKVLNQEVGEGVNFQTLLNTPSTWRGRQQQIITLQQKVTELKAQVETLKQSGRSEQEIEDEFMGIKSASLKQTLDNKHREQIRKLEKERKDTQERAATELRALEEDHGSLKHKLDASKARSTVLSNEVKCLKQQMQTLLEKGKHDDELITALLSQQTQMRQMLAESTTVQNRSTEEKEERMKQMSMKTQQDNNIVEQLKEIVAEREAAIKELEVQIKHLQIENVERVQKEGMTAVFQLPDPEINIENSTAVVDDNTHVNVKPSSSSNNQQIKQHPKNAWASSGGAGTARPNSAAVDRPNSRAVTSARSRPGSRNTSARQKQDSGGGVVDKETYSHLVSQHNEYKTMLQAVQVERDKLVELVQVTQQRLNETTDKLSESQNDLIQQRRKCVQTEKQLGKAKLESQSQLSARTGNKRKTDEIGDTSLTETLEELQVSLEIQQDENEALKLTLQNTLKAKEQDHSAYLEMVEQIKSVFLQALRQYKDNSKRAL